MLTPKQLETVRQQLTVAESVDKGGFLDAQLQQLLLKHFMLHVGVDVCLAEFVVAVKNAAHQILLSARFETITEALSNLSQSLRNSTVRMFIRLKLPSNVPDPIICRWFDSYKLTGFVSIFTMGKRRNIWPKQEAREED